MKEFNTTGTCFPNKHYMVDISERLAGLKPPIEICDKTIIETVV